MTIVGRSAGTHIVPASTNLETEVQSEVVKISPDFATSAPLYLLAGTANPGRKLPLLVYFHGGDRCLYHNHMNPLLAETNIVVVLVSY